MDDANLLFFSVAACIRGDELVLPNVFSDYYKMVSIWKIIEKKNTEKNTKMSKFCLPE